MPQEQAPAILPRHKSAGFFDSLIQDLHYALRHLRGNPGFAAVAILTLALGIGANTSIFTLVNTVMLTRLPVGHPEQLVLFHWLSHTKGPYIWNRISAYSGCDMTDPGSDSSNCSFSFPDFENFRTHSQSFQGIAAYGGGANVQVDMHGQAARANGQYVSGEFFSVLQVPPVYGRVLNPSDDLPGAPPVVVLDYRYWQKQFNSDPGVVGGSILFNSVPFTIAGVAPPEFYGLAPGNHPAFWIPLHVQEQLGKDRFPRFEARSIWLYLVARLKPGIPQDRARAEIEVMFRASLANIASTVAAGPEKDRPKTALDTNLNIAFTSAERGLTSLRQNYSTQLFVLTAAAGLILLIACANIANLLLARAAARRKEIGVRLALGASRGRLLSQLLTESLLLASLGCALGLVVSYWASRGLVYIVFSAKANDTILTLFRPNLLVFGFSAAVAIMAAVLFGLAPALTSIRVTPGSTLKAAGSNSSPSEGRNRLGRLLVTIEMALALVLVIGAGLFLRTLITLETLDPGFRTDHLLTFSVSPSAAKIPEDNIPALGQEIQRRLAALPGVQGVTWSSFPLLSGSLWRTSLKIQELPELHEVETQQMSIGPQYFDTMKIPLLSGRGITLQDCRKDFPGVWVNRAFVDKYLKNVTPLGTHLIFGQKPLEVFGIVGNAKYESVKGDFKPTMYTAMPGGDFSFQMRTAVKPDSLEDSVRKTVAAVAAVAANLPIEDLSTLQEGIDADLSQENSMARLSAGFGFLALLLAAIGIYGVSAYSVARRTSEIAIRMSLGAMPRNIFTLVLKEGLLPALLGAVVGLLASWGLTRLVQQFLYGVKPLDAATFAIATAILFAIAAAACLIPARRAMRVEPMIALRYE